MSSSHFSLAYCKPPLPQWSNNWMWVPRYLQHDQIWFLFIYTGLCFSKPSVILLLEQGKEPWMAKREMTKDLCSGEWRGNRHAKTFAGYSPAWLKGSTSSLCCGMFLSNVLGLSRNLSPLRLFSESWYSELSLLAHFTPSTLSLLPFLVSQASSSLSVLFCFNFGWAGSLLQHTCFL